MTTDDATRMCPCCGYVGQASGCAICAGSGRTLGRRSVLHAGRGNPILDVLRGLDGVRRAGFALVFEREFIGKLRGPVAANAIASIVLLLIGWLWLAPAFGQWFASRQATSANDGPHLWLMATWLTAGPPLLDLLAGFAQEPIRRATERHMLGVADERIPRPGPRLAERVQLVLLAAVALPMALGIVLIPWVGIPAVVLLGAAIAALVWFQPPLAARGLDLQKRLEILRRNPWRALGTGLGLQMAVAVPFVNVLGLSPIATIAATSAYLQFDKLPPNTVAPE